MVKISSVQMSVLAAASLALIGVAGCEKPGPAEIAGKKVDRAVEKLGDDVGKTADVAREQTARASQAMDDAAITTAIKAHILAEPGLKVLKIDVETVNGIVTLSGSADTQQNADKAVQLASAVQGVKLVENRIAVGSATTG